jgi:zinc protease
MFKSFSSSARTQILLLLAWLLGCAGAPAGSGGAATPVAAAPGDTTVAATAAAAAVAPATSPSLPLDPSVTTGTLSNGLRFYLKRHKPTDQRVHLLLVVKAGSLHEEEDQRGLAHFVEHMAFNGTSRFSKQELMAFFEKSGIAFGSDMNASTSYDRTQYQLHVPTDDPKLLATALDVLEDWAGSVVFADEAVQQERSVILSEWLARQGVGRRVGKQTLDLLLAGSRYLEREPIGEKALLEQASRQRLLDFYRRWYHPERMAIVAVGDIDPAQVETMVRERFTKLPAGKVEAEPSRAIAVASDPIAAVITDPELQASSVSFMLKAPGRGARTEAELRTRILLRLGTQMLNRRFAEIAQRPDAPFTGAFGNVSNVFDALDLFEVGGRAKQGRIPASLAALLEEVERVERHGFTSGEFGREKSDLARALERRVAEQATVPVTAIAFGVANFFVTGEAATAPEFDRDFGLRLLGEVDVDDVTQALRTRLGVGQKLVVASGASRDAMPEKASLIAALASAERKEVEAYQDRAIVTDLLPRAPTPGRIVSEKRIEAVGLTEWSLSNGARVVLKPTDFAADEVIGQASSFGGHARVRKSDFPSARYAADIVQASGAGQFDRLTLAKALSGKVVSVSPWLDELSEGIGSRAAPKDLETMFQLLHLCLTAPRRDEQAFAAWLGRFREQLRNRDLNPASVFGEAVAQKLWGNELRRLPPTLASLDEINLDTALKLYAERFADVSDFTFVFVGKIDEAAFRPLVERYLASLPGKGRKEAFKNLGLHRRKGVSEVTVHAGKEDKTYVSLMFHGEAPWSENAHTDLDSLDTYLGIRVREVLREKLGNVYSPSVSYGFSRLPYDSYNLSVSFESKPGDVDRLLQATRDVIAEVKKSGIDASYVEKLRSERTRDVEEYYRSNAFWLERLVDKYRMKEDPRQILTLHELTQRVTSDNVRSAAQKFLRDDQYLIARLEPAAVAPEGDGKTPATGDGTTPPASGVQTRPSGGAKTPAAGEQGRTPSSRSTPPAAAPLLH